MTSTRHGDTPTPVPAGRYGSKTQTSPTMTSPPPLRPRLGIQARTRVVGGEGVSNRHSSPHMFRFMVGRCMRRYRACARGMLHMALSAAAKTGLVVVMTTAQIEGRSDLARDGDYPPSHSPAPAPTWHKHLVPPVLCCWPVMDGRVRHMYTRAHMSWRSKIE